MMEKLTGLKTLKWQSIFYSSIPVFCRFGSHLVCRSLGKELCIFSYLSKISCCQEQAAKIVPCIFFWKKAILQIGAYDV